MALPVVIRCDCGGEARGHLGAALTCPACGRTYETKGVRSEQLGAAYRMQVHQRVMSKIGVGLIGLVAVLAFYQVGRFGLLGGLIIGGLVWYGAVMPLSKRRLVRKVEGGATTRIESS
jgi:hypothetical protein